jgi:hypothetical protein
MLWDETYLDKTNCGSAMNELLAGVGFEDFNPNSSNEDITNHRRPAPKQPWRMPWLVR